MGWRDAPEVSAAGGWKSAPEVGPEQEQPGIGKSLVGGALQGVTLGFGDEISGGVMRMLLGDGVRLGKGAQPAPDDAPELRAAKLKALEEEKALPTSYEIGRDLIRGDLKEAQEANPKAFLGGELLGGVLLPVPGGAAAKGLSYGQRLLRAMGQGAAMGGAYGLGSSESGLNRGNYADTAVDTLMGAGLGTAGGALAEGVVAPVVTAGGKLLAKGGRAIRDWASKGTKEAGERALAMARKEGTEEIGSLTGTLGGETQKGSRMTENIRRIPGEAAAATPESQAALMRDAARIARQRAEDMIQQAKAAGLDEAPDRIGEFLSKGSKVDKAQKARSQAQRLMEGAKQMEADAERVLRGELSPKALDANLQRAREFALDSAAFKQLEGTVLSENIRALPDQVAKIESARAARDVALRDFEANAQKRAEDLLSGRAAKERLKESAKRYALPLAGGYLGQEMGDDYGVLGKAAGFGLGYKLGGGMNGALGALGGAGMRPALQSLYRTATQYPAVSRLLYGTASKLAPRGAGVATKLPALLQQGSRSEEAMGMGRLFLEALKKERMLAGEEDSPGLAAQ